MTKKRQQIRCKILTPREIRLEKIRASLTIVVPELIRGIKASGKDTQAGFEKELSEHVRNGSAVQALLARAMKIWVDDKTDECNIQSVYLIAQTLAALSFVPGGTTAAIGTKFMGLEFDAEDFK